MYLGLFLIQFNKPALNGAQAAGTSSTTLPGTATTGNGQQPEEATTEVVPSDIFDYYDKMDNEEEEGEDLKMVSFEVKQDRIEDIQKR